MNRDDFINELTNIMELERGVLAPKSRLGDFSEWDSMAVLTVIAMIDKDFNKKISMDKIESFETVQDIYDFLGV